VLVGQARAVDLRVDDVGDEVVARVGLAVLDDRGEVFAQATRGRRRRGVVLGPEVDGLGQLVEQLVVLERHPEHAPDDLHGVSGGHLGHQVGAPGGAELVDEAVDGGADELVTPSLERGGAECAGDQVPVAAVLVTVHGQDHGPHHRAHGVGVDARREDLGVAQDALDVTMAGDEVQVLAEALDRLDRLVATAPLPEGVDVRFGLAQLGRLRPVRGVGARHVVPPPMNATGRAPSMSPLPGPVGRSRRARPPRPEWVRRRCPGQTRPPPGTVRA
jgi:hypothetical protein